MRFTNDMLSMFTSRIVRGMAPPMINVFLVCTFVCSYETLLANGDLAVIDPMVREHV